MATASVADLQAEIEARAHTFVLEMQRTPDPEWADEGFWNRFASSFSEKRCGPLDGVPPEDWLTEVWAFSHFMPRDAVHGPELDQLWEAYTRYLMTVWDLLEAIGEQVDADPGNPRFAALHKECDECEARGWGETWAERHAKGLL